MLVVLSHRDEKPVLGLFWAVVVRVEARSLRTGADSLFLWRVDLLGLFRERLSDRLGALKSQEERGIRGRLSILQTAKRFSDSSPSMSSKSNSSLENSEPMEETDCRSSSLTHLPTYLSILMLFKSNNMVFCTVIFFGIWSNNEEFVSLLLFYEHRIMGWMTTASRNSGGCIPTSAAVLYSAYYCRR